MSKVIVALLLVGLVGVVSAENASGLAPEESDVLAEWVLPKAYTSHKNAPKCTKLWGTCIDTRKTKCLYAGMKGELEAKKCPGDSKVLCCKMPNAFKLRLQQRKSEPKKTTSSGSSAWSWIKEAVKHTTLGPIYSGHKMYQHISKRISEGKKSNSNTGGNSNNNNNNNNYTPIAGGNGKNPGKNARWFPVCEKKYNKDKCSFLKTVMLHCYDIMPSLGVPPQVAISQAVLETGWGEHFRYNNILGIKCPKEKNGRPKRGVPCFSASTREHYRNNDKIKTQRYFRKFDSIRACLEFYAKTVTKGRYTGAKKYIRDPPRFLTYLWASYYASSYTYVGKGVKLMRNIKDATNLPEFDQSIDSSLQRSIDWLVKKRENERNGWSELRAARDKEDANGFRR